MNKVKVKAFVEALSNFHDNLSEMKKYPSDKRLTQTEKKILESWLLLADNKLTQILETIPKLVTDYDELVESQKELIWGIALNNKGEFHLAKPHIEASIPTLVKNNLFFHTFTAYHNLFIVNFNLNDLLEMEYCLEQMGNSHPHTKRQNLLFQQCQFYYFGFTNQFDKATKILNIIEKRKSEMTGAMLVSHLLSQFHYYVKQEKLDQCQIVLNEFKHLKKFAFGANYRFMNILLSNLKENTPIYAYEKDFSEFPFLYHQIMVVKLLEENNVQDALWFWQKLQQNFPATYQDSFSYTGKKCLFSIALEKYKHSALKPQMEAASSSNKEKAIIKILRNLTTPISKAQLYQLVWKEETADKFEMAKMQRMISRLRHKGFEISFRKGCYQLEKNKKKAS